jgi:hypothetical protein
MGERIEVRGGSVYRYLAPHPHLLPQALLSRCFVIPAKAGIQFLDFDEINLWIPAFAGMTGFFEFKSKNAFTVIKAINNGTLLLPQG